MELVTPEVLCDNRALFADFNDTSLGNEAKSHSKRPCNSPSSIVMPCPRCSKYRRGDAILPCPKHRKQQLAIPVQTAVTTSDIDAVATDAISYHDYLCYEGEDRGVAVVPIMVRCAI